MSAVEPRGKPICLVDKNESGLKGKTGITRAI